MKRRVVNTSYEVVELLSSPGNLYRFRPPSSTRSLHELVALHAVELPAIAIMVIPKPTRRNALNIPSQKPETQSNVAQARRQIQALAFQIAWT
jgi:hypothetical protein